MLAKGLEKLVQTSKRTKFQRNVERIVLWTELCTLIAMA